MPIRLSPWVVTAALLALVVGLAAKLLAEPMMLAVAPASVEEHIQHLVLLYATLPRLAIIRSKAAWTVGSSVVPSSM